MLQTVTVLTQLSRGVCLVINHHSDDKIVLLDPFHNPQRGSELYLLLSWKVVNRFLVVAKGFVVEKSTIRCPPNTICFSYKVTNCFKVRVKIFKVKSF